jgi:ribosome biogenesis GTPase
MTGENWHVPARFLRAFADLAEPGLTLGRVQQAGGDRVHVLFPGADGSAGCESALCVVRSAAGEPWPVSGDWVAASRELGLITHVLPRSAEITRRAAGTVNTPQTLAANMDWVFVLMALDHDFSTRRLERYLVLCQNSGAHPVVFLTKTALCDDVDAALAEVERVTASTARVHAIDVLAGIGADTPASYLQEDSSAALLGSSGVGKSTLVNHLLGSERARTQPVRDADSKGRHTTTRRELFLLPNGAAVIDTPGMRELALWADADAVREAFADIANIASGCRFRDCTHGAEPGCAVRAARESGTLAGARLDSYQRLLTETEAGQALRSQHERRARARQNARLLRDVQTRKYGRKT